MNKEELRVQLAVGSLTPKDLFLMFLKTQQEKGILSNDWDDNRVPRIKPGPFIFINTVVELSECVCFEFDPNGNFIGI